MLPHMALDIQLQIIERLPVKSLIRFRSVCKPWKSFIDSSQFIAGYRTQSQHLVISYIVGHWNEGEVKYVCFVDDDDDDSFPQQKFALTVPPLDLLTTIVGSSHGLLCFTSYFGDNTPMVVLWNPAIRKSIVVAVPNVVGRRFDSVLGFGVCPDTKDPKLVKITFSAIYRKMESIPCQVMVFTLSSGKWTCLCNNQLPRKSIRFTMFQAVIGQFIYWLAYNWINVDGTRRLDRPRNLIMSFDMSSLEFREIDLPDCLAEQRLPDLSIFRLRESLAVVEYGWKRLCTVWMMEHGDSKSFTKLFTVNPPNASVWRTAGFRKSGEPIVEIVQGEDMCTLVVYEPCSKHIMDLGIHRIRYPSFASSYTESLLLLDYDDGHIVRCGAMKR